MSHTRTFPTRIAIPEANRAALIALLNAQLADVSDLATQTKFAHWNVKGVQFIALHELFDDFVAHLTTAADDIAERATALGGMAYGTARHVVQASRLPEYPENAVTGPQHLTALAERFALVAQSTRAAIDTATKLDDASTADLFTGLSRTLDKDLWFIEAHLQG
jgi:starvation-inducible DNA-binding protein